MSVETSKTGLDRGVPTDDAWKMALPATPAPPPLYHTQWLPSPPDSPLEFYDDHHQNLCESSPHSSGHRGSSAAMEGEFGAKLLEPTAEVGPIIKVEKQSRPQKIVSLPVPCQGIKQELKTRPAPSRQPFTDPRRLLSHDTRFDDPRPRYLKIDLASTRPVVISPVPMIAMPFGDIVEAAYVYSKDATEYR
ncbi:uncharacterized protein MYCFIDRAFT_76995 [Pseudocercospora fijiensis CIRAD86]|uniref:Uncharacterized protein n=1 Tax=Pseudocercospora fijiensis (strain CIRAD86) TaxID=383855 RepID=M3A8V7_PSEFD|nr:uncharacterized protein MYCFIDRAFT_76995 [Pseudocercospora fijiensis CIRAD86]EME81061.1 hypothetical protein MYCFIDRAFT_76995 [Pseudocercospora fijiensis CIRAD86]